MTPQFLNRDQARQQQAQSGTDSVIAALEEEIAVRDALLAMYTERIHQLELAVAQLTVRGGFNVTSDGDDSAVAVQ